MPYIVVFSETRQTKFPTKRIKIVDWSTNRNRFSPREKKKKICTNRITKVSGK